MYIVDINNITDIKQELSIIPDDSDICIMDQTEVERLWPLDQNNGCDGENFEQRRVVYDITKTFENYKNDIYYICSDCNIFRRYEKWCLSDPKKELKVYCFPFKYATPSFPLLYYMHDYKSIIQDMKDKVKGFKAEHFFRWAEGWEGGEGWTIDNQTVENYENIIPEKTKNFITLVSSPKLIRILFLDKFYNHKKMEYSFFPYYHIHDNQGKPLDSVTHNNIRLSSHVLKLPYKWSNDGQYLQTINNDRVPSCLYFVNSKFNKLQNGFNFKEHSRELTEFMCEWRSNTLNKDIFDEALPIETYNSCCDIVFESYTNTDSVFFTEKTWKEIVFKRPFITFGAKNQNQIFKKLGFELYDDIFNYDFETRKTLENRFNDFNDQILYFLNMNTDHFFQQMNTLNDKINYNYNHYVKQINKNKWVIAFQKNKEKLQGNDYKERPYIVDDNDYIFKNALLELENIKQILK